MTTRFTPEQYKAMASSVETGVHFNVKTCVQMLEQAAADACREGENGHYKGAALLFRSLVSNDAQAITFQSLGSYRTWLIEELDRFINAVPLEQSMANYLRKDDAIRDSEPFAWYYEDHNPMFVEPAVGFTLTPKEHDPATLKPLYTAPQAKPAANMLAGREILTYKNQPGNVGAWSIGEASSKASKNPGGDYIDGGLSLLKELQEKGYGIISLTSRNPLL